MACSEHIITLSLNTHDADGGLANNSLKIGLFTWNAVCQKDLPSGKYELRLEVETPPLALWSIEMALKVVILIAPIGPPNRRNKYLTYHATLHRRLRIFRIPLVAAEGISLVEFANNESPSLEVEVHLSLGRIWIENLGNPSDLSDTVLLVGGTRLHVSKSVLSMHSEFFQNLFNDSRDEYRVDDVELEDFITFLSIIYPTALPVEDENYERMLGLADTYKCNAVFNAFSKYLQRARRADPEALVTADHYNLIQDVDRILACLPASTIRMMTVRGPLSLRVSDRLKVMMLERLARFDDQVSVDVSTTPVQYDPYGLPTVNPPRKRRKTTRQGQ